jgi:hypothetical protein
MRRLGPPYRYAREDEVRDRLGRFFAPLPDFLAAWREADPAEIALGAIERIHSRRVAPVPVPPGIGIM